MTTKQMDYCIELARTLNFTRAAENQFVSQPLTVALREREPLYVSPQIVQCKCCHKPII
jgi:hypothetical protein